MKLIIGDLSTFTIESHVSKSYARPSLRALGSFILHVGGRSYGVQSEEATMLACSFDEVGRRLSRRGTHVAPFGDAPDALTVGEAIYNATYGADGALCSIPGLSLNQVKEIVDFNHLQWAPDGDAAFDDGSFVIQMETGERVRLIAFKTIGDGTRRIDASSLRDQWLDSDIFYQTLQDWHHAFESELSRIPTT